uniref:Uncharacterized protein n=1 Tax=Eucampia antarctica TaxID=49252 RepID=A0A7S2W0M6_9STRA|mmetsp:Transcript_87796/g.196239  ORF Transcript_87796/g.196239 Transcript_87796/m.196239 type:complete len:126 (-) Transcript_87796:137-514(-)
MVHISSTSNTDNANEAYITEGMEPSVNACKRFGAALVNFPLTIATGVIETSTIGEPLPYYGRDAAKGNMAGENIVGTAIWAGTFTGCDIQCRRGSHYTESIHICRGDKDGVVANRYDDMYYVASE